uniref:Corticotropin-releasing factor domain-containing protein n=1 Tax=Strigamia maritima TaxID=126957 RepID=T1JJJ6_STRMM
MGFKIFIVIAILLASILTFTIAEDNPRKTISLLDSGPTLNAFRRLIKDRERARLHRMRERERSRYRRLRDRLRSTASRLGINA